MPPQPNTPMPPAPPFNTPPTPSPAAPPPQRKRWPFIVGGVLVLLAAIVFVLSRAGSPTSDDQFLSETTPGVPMAESTEFENPELVTIEGYDGPAQDPTLSPDGTILFFDSHTDDPKIPVKLYWAKKTDYKTFVFQGEIRGVNQSGGDSITGTMDRNYNFYFTSTSLTPPLPVIARGVFTDGTVANVAPIKGLPSPASGPWSPGQTITVPVSVQITPDGNTLYLSELELQIGSDRRPGKPVGGTISVKSRNSDGAFTKKSNSDSLLKNVNALGKILYGAVESTDGLELYFTGSDDPTAGGDHIRIYVARRSLASEPFGTPEEITTPWKLVESPYPSSDGTHLYFHRIISGSDAKVYVMTRRE